jgi:putative nucleotidyltransferase with HDIG domain
LAETILVVEDEPVVSELLAGLLETEGFNVVTVDSGEAALQFLRGTILGLGVGRQPVDLILLDILLPGIDGYKLCQIVKQDPELEYIPVIMLTARASTSDRVLGLELGADDYISKPFECAEVLARVKSTLRTSRAEHELRRRNKELAAIAGIATTLQQSLDLDEVLRLALDKVLEITGLAVGGIMLLDEDEETLSYRIHKGLSEQFVSATDKLKLGEGISGRVALSVRPLLTEDLLSDPRVTRAVVQREDLKCFATIPLKSKNRVLGVLAVGSHDSFEFSSTDSELLGSIGAQIGVALENARMYLKVHDVYLNTIRSLSKAIDARDPCTSGHSEAVARYAVATARKIGLSREDVDLIEVAGLLHDIGKIGTKEAILQKNACLSPEERDEMCRHVLVSKEILEPIAELRRIIPWIYHHHECVDGRGYPSGLRGEEIPLPARILAVADSFSAMMTDRPYRSASGKEEAIKELRRASGSQFDPAVVEALVEALSGI